jgi:hypothetical protein
MKLQSRGRLDDDRESLRERVRWQIHLRLWRVRDRFALLPPWGQASVVWGLTILIVTGLLALDRFVLGSTGHVIFNVVTGVLLVGIAVQAWRNRESRR